MVAMATPSEPLTMITSPSQGFRQDVMQMGHLTTDSEHQVGFGAGQAIGQSGVHVGALVTQLQHVAEYGDAASARPRRGGGK